MAALIPVLVLAIFAARTTSESSAAAVTRRLTGVSQAYARSLRSRLGAAETIGVRAILVHAISDQARAFYEHWGLRTSPIEPMTLMITVDEARRMLERAS